MVRLATLVLPRRVFCISLRRLCATGVGMMVERVLGPAGGTATSVVVMLQCFLVTVAYSIALSGTLADFLRTWELSVGAVNPLIPELGRTNESNRRTLVLLIAVFVLWPISMFRNFNGMRHGQLSPSTPPTHCWRHVALLPLHSSTPPPRCPSQYSSSSSSSRTALCSLIRCCSRRGLPCLRGDLPWHPLPIRLGRWGGCPVLRTEPRP